MSWSHEMLCSLLLTISRSNHWSHPVASRTSAGPCGLGALRLLEQEKAQLAGIPDDLIEGFQQAEHGDLAEGSGADAIRRAFTRACITS